MKKAIVFPITIIIAGMIIAGGVIFSRNEIANPEPEIIAEENNFDIEPVTIDDHILGNPDADILIIEYADFECPFCADFHPTMERIVNEYAKDSRVAWVYRHFPLEKIHPQSKKAAVASECVSSILGKSFFWNFTSQVYSEAPNSLSDDGLKKIAIDLGVNEEEYNQCIQSGKFEEKIKNNIEDGKKIYEYDPDFATPYSIIITKNGYRTIINGVRPYQILKEIIEKNSFSL